MDKKLLLSLVSALCVVSLSRPMIGQGLMVLEAGGQVTVDNPVTPTLLHLEVNVLFAPDPINPADPLNDDVTVRVDYRPVPCIDVFIPAGSFVPSQQPGELVVEDPLSRIVVTLETPPDPNDPNQQPIVVDLAEELISADIRLIESRPDPCFLKIELVFASQHPGPCFLPLNAAAKAVALAIADQEDEVGITRFEFAGQLAGSAGSLTNVAARGTVEVDNAANPSSLAVEYAIGFRVGANSNGIDPLEEDVTLNVELPEPCFIVFVPAGSFQQAKKGLNVDDPVGSGVEFLLEYPPPPSEPNPQPQIVDLAHELQFAELTLANDTLRLEALFASQHPEPCFLPLNDAPLSFDLAIGDDGGAVLPTEISFSGP
jgi:hypothetical protein